MAKEKAKRYAVTYDGLKGSVTTQTEFIVDGSVIDHKDGLVLKQGQPVEVSKSVYEKLEVVARKHSYDSEFTFTDEYEPPAEPEKVEGPAESTVTESKGINEPDLGVTDVTGTSEPPAEKQALEGSGVGESDTGENQ